MKRSASPLAQLRIRLDGPAMDLIEAQAKRTGKSVSRIINERIQGDPLGLGACSPQTMALLKLMLAGIMAVEQITGSPWHQPENQKRAMQALQRVLGAAYPDDQKFNDNVAAATLAAVTMLANTRGE